MHAPKQAAEESSTSCRGESIGPYKLLELIGEGGFGSVFLAEQEAPVRRRVALKIIKPGMETRQIVARFEAERQALALMDHPNIAKVFDADVTDAGRPYFVMELVRGESITRYCNRERLTIRGRLELFIAVCLAVQHAHGKGIIHRDIKPSNVLVTLVDSRPVPKVIDFGIAKAAAGRLTDKTLFTEQRQLIGTPEYMSPEQAGMTGIDIDTRSDVYSLGVLLYELLTGVTPFDARQLRSAEWGELQRIIREEEPPRPSTRLARSTETLIGVAAERRVTPQRLPLLVRGDLDWIAMKCLEKDRVRRYPTADALAADVRLHLEGRPISARSPSAAYVLRKLAMKHRVVVTAAMLVLLTIIAATIGLALLAHDLDRAGRRTEAALSDSTVQRARLMAGTGDAHRAELLLWTEALHAGMRTDDSLCVDGSSTELRSAWSLVELYARIPRLFRTRLDMPGSEVGIDPARRTVWCFNGSRQTWDLDGRLLEQTPAPIDFEHARRRMIDPSGRYKALQGEDSLVVCDVASGASIAGPVPWNKDVLLTDISDDGAWLLFRNTPDNSAVNVVDAKTLSQVATFGPPAFSARFQRLPEGLVVVIGSRGGDNVQVVVRRAPDWEVIRTLPFPGHFLPGPNASVRHVGLTSDGTYLHATVLDNSVLFRLGAGEAAVVAEHGARSSVNCAGFDEAGRTLAAGLSDGAIVVHRIPDLLPLVTIPNVEVPTAVATRADLGIVVASDVAGRVSAYETGDRPWLERMPASELTKESLAVAPDGAIAWGDDRGMLSIRTSGAPDGTITVHAQGAAITTVAFSSNGAEILTSGYDGAINIWRRDGSRSRTIGTGLTTVWSARESPDGRTIASAGAGGSAQVWTVSATTPALVLDCHTLRVPMVAFSPDSKSLATAASPGTARLWDIRTGAQVLQLAQPSPYVRAIAFSLDGRTIVTGADDRTVRVFDARTGSQLRAIEGLPWAVFDLKFHPGGKVLFAVGRGGELVAIDPIAGVELAKLSVHGQLAFSIATSPDGRRIYTCGQDPWIGIIDLDRLRSYIRGNEAFWKDECAPHEEALPRRR